MPIDFADWLQHAQFKPAEIRQRAREVYDCVLKQSAHIRRGNFEAIHPLDLKLLWQAYDDRFFAGRLSRALGDAPVQFRLSRRLTSAAGQATRRRVRRTLGGHRSEYEISVSTTLLFQTFQEDIRPITASGVLCQDRLEALQRVFEHELVHVSEMLVWSDSSCSAPRFQGISRRLFGHREHTHQLITPRERAWKQLGLRVGDRVQFRRDGRTYVGWLNRITRRATVLVEDPRGRRYTDGNLYAKFYVPLSILERGSP